MGTGETNKKLLKAEIFNGLWNQKSKKNSHPE
jgi:hypothetical protein